MKTLYTFLILALMIFSHAMAQESTISGIIKDISGSGMPGANIYIKGTYDGVSSNTDGNFTLKTLVRGEQILIVSYIGFIEQQIPIDIQGDKYFEIILKAVQNELSEVVIAAGAFEASDEKRGVVLKPLDILTTPTAEGDIYGALKTLPGAQTVGEDGRLFVRGGDHYESSTFIDGMLVQQPYYSTTPDIPARGRFSPQLFTGTLFSTGGFSAEFGQALSSALILNTVDMPAESFTSIGLLNVGASLGHTQKWERSAISASLDYTNLKPYFALAKPKDEYTHEPEVYGGTISGRKMFSENGMWKSMATYSHDHTGVYYPNLEAAEGELPYDLVNDNLYANSVIKNTLNKNWMYYGGVSASWNRDKVRPGEAEAIVESSGFQAKNGYKYIPYNGMTINFGGIYSYSDYSRKFRATADTTFLGASYQDHNPALYAEGEWNFSGKLALRTGFRGEYSSLQNHFNLAPRLSAAFQTGAHSQISAAYGHFYQSPQSQYLAFNNSLNFEEAQHYILNYQYQHNDRIFRLETYWKNYNNLTKFDLKNQNYEPEYYSNEGKGYARGIDIFYRDWKTIDWLDFWVSYSYIDTKRDYRNYPSEVQPSFVANHQLSIVAKYWFNSINTQIGASYTFTSGRPYENPNIEGFMNQKTKNYHDLSINCSHLMDVFGNFTILYISLSNVTAADHIYGYRYYSLPSPDGEFGEYPVTDGLKHFLVVGLFMNIN